MNLVQGLDEYSQLQKAKAIPITTPVNNTVVTQTPTLTAPPTPVNQQLPSYKGSGASMLNTVANPHNDYSKYWGSTPASQQQQPLGMDLMGLNAQLVAAQKAAKLSGLQNALNSSMSALNQQDALIDPQAYNDRSKTSTASQLGAKNFAEFVANKGLTNSGTNAQAELTRNMQLQGDIGAIDLQARNQHNSIATKKTDLQNAYNNDVAAANAQIEADSLARQIDLAKSEQARKDQLDQFEKQYGINLASLTGTINGQKTMQGQQNDLNLISQNLQNQNQATANSYQKQLLDQQVRNGQISNDMAQAQYDEFINPNSITNQAKALGLKTDQLNYKIQDATTQAQIDSILADLKGKNISNESAQYQLDELTDPNSITNQMNRIDLATKQQNLTQSKAEYSEWLKMAPTRLAVAKQQAAQATSATELAKIEAKISNEELLAKKITTANLTQQQKDEHAKVLQDIADSRSTIANRAAQLGLDKQQLQLEKDKFNASLTKPSTKNPVSNTVSAAYADYLKAKDKDLWMKQNVQYMTNDEFKIFMAQVNKDNGQ